jgi:peroxiredoxin
VKGDTASRPRTPSSEIHFAGITLIRLLHEPLARGANHAEHQVCEEAIHQDDIGISGDSSTSQQKFASQHRLPFLLAPDTDGQIRQTLGVPKSLGIFPGRVMYVVDKQGVIRHIFNSQLDAERHVREALATLREIK